MKAFKHHWLVVW